MEERGALGGAFDGTYNKLTSPEDFGADDDYPLYADQGRQRVSMSMAWPESSINHYRRLTVSLAVVAAILLAVDIGLGAYYRSLSSDHTTVEDISREIAKLQASYDAAVQRKEEALKQLKDETAQQTTTKWEEEHQRKRTTDYQKQIDKLKNDISSLQSHIPLIVEGCRHCLPGWTFLQSSCFAFPDTNTRSTWYEARQFCKSRGSDLAIIDNKEKQLAISELIRGNVEPSRGHTLNGHWIGLTDEEEEGVWKWPDGTTLLEGYWNYGEPNNQNNEDCAATYPVFNPFNSWNDAPCNYNLKWICERAAMSTLS